MDPILKSNPSKPRRFAILCGFAFTAGRDLDEKIVKSRKSNEISDVKNTLRAATDLIIQRVLPSKGQSDDWGVRAFKVPLDLLRLPMSRESETRRKILLCCAHLLNLRTRKVGFNQICTVYSRKDAIDQPRTSRLEKEQNGIRLG